MHDNVVVKVEHLSKTFKLPHEEVRSIKSALINLARHKHGYEIQHALKNVSFSVSRGEFFGIVGLNGSGKSTLLKLLAGIYTPTKGSIQVNGKLTPFIELGVGFNPELTGRENVFLNGALLGFNRKEMLAMYDDIVSFAELERFMDQKLKNYSSGMQVRLAFSIAIKAQSDILLLDEVLAVGDAAFQQKCFDYFEKLKQQTKTVIFVSHDMAAVNRFCTQAIYVRDGILQHIGKPQEVADLYVEDNMRRLSDGAPSIVSDNMQAEYKISANISSQSKDELTVRVRYQAPEGEKVYIALSVIYAGHSVAELTTPPSMNLHGSGELLFSLDLTLFNSGVYELPMILCKQRNREVVSLCISKNRFVIKGSDITRGAALRLPDTWREEK